MAAAEEQGVSPFPDPPTLFYKLYTDSNVQSGRAPPPPVPVKGPYTVFGAPFDTQDALIRSLESQGIERLYPEKHDKKAELKKLNRSIAICFLELLDILIKNPASQARIQKIEDLTHLFINMHHLINEFRPHQARETLKVILERQKKQRDEVIIQVQRATEQARLKLKEFTESILEAVANLQQSESILGTASDQSDAMDVSVSGAHSSLEANESLDKLNEEFVEQQDLELCTLIDSYIRGSMPL